ncbi:LysR family transcriptional regulator [Spongiibacter nanhainus]|uniref:LysR family transcriptional regulator n=1 Tax=Spongiibacter nanhainus TaxID=2794344 RepID=A0A7T4R2G5_9GAMM|nr:LysR family transcriptional regulator [Spongiibacter nanhainus]QQD19155.1 LysR family transcriptional regulator [Spongiibacter nanhainus]
MDWDDIRYFMVLARTGSLSQAAKVLGVTHVTVSRRITRLEQQRQVKLFDRRQSGYRLTTAGERLLTEGEAVEESCMHFERKIRGQSDVLAGPLTLSIPETTLLDLSAPIAAFMCRYPAIELTVFATSEQHNLNQSQADVLIRMTDHPPELLVGRQLAVVPMYAYGTRGYLDSIDGDMSRADWVIWQAAFGRAEGDKYFRNMVQDAHITLRTNSNSQLVAMVRQGVVLGLMTAPIARRYPELLPASEQPLVSSQIWLLTHADLRDSARVRCFMQFMTEWGIDL